MTAMTKLLDDLDRAGFFQYANDTEKSALKEEVLRTGFLFPDDVQRAYFADAEDLAEQGVLDFLSQIAPFLIKQGIRIPLREENRGKRRERHPNTGEIIEVDRVVLVVDDKVPDDPKHPFLKPIKEELPESNEYYRVTIGRHSQEIWNEKMSGEDCWDAGMSHTFLLINRLLEDAGSSERLFGLYGGNDGYAVFLTEEQFNIIKASNALKESDKPWKPYVVAAK